MESRSLLYSPANAALSPWPGGDALKVRLQGVRAGDRVRVRTGATDEVGVVEHVGLLHLVVNGTQYRRRTGEQAGQVDGLRSWIEPISEIVSDTQCDACREGLFPNALPVAEVLQ